MLDVFTEKNWSSIDREIADDVFNIKRNWKDCLAGRAPLTARTYSCVFQSEVDSGHWSSDLRCTQQEVENSAESKTLFKYKI